MVGAWNKGGINGAGVEDGFRVQLPSEEGKTGVFGAVSGLAEPTTPQKKMKVFEPPPTLHLLIVDGDEAVRSACGEIATKMGFVVVSARDMATAEAILKHRKVDLLLLDLKVSGGDGGLALLENVKTLHPDTSVIVMTAFATVENAVEAMRVGAGDYLTKPFALDELKTVLERAGARTHFDLESRRLRERLRNYKGGSSLIGRSPEMEKMYRILSKVAHTNHPVLILGESGTGKEVVARSIHFNGPNAQKPFVPVDCGSLQPELIESEVFGYAKGAAIGASRVVATKAKVGLLAAADGGTVFLDEIGELPLDLQVKLLRALTEKAVTPVGGTQAMPISVRVLAASNRDLAAMVEQGRFRRDLYAGLNVVNLRIPALRDRKEDIPLLTQHFLDVVQREKGVAHTFSDEALRTMMAYDWPGNVRELQMAIEHACALSSGPILHMGDLPTQLQDLRMHGRASALRAVASGVDVEAGGEEAEGAKILPIAEMEKIAILGTIRQSERRQADGREAAGHRQDDALPEAERVRVRGGGRRRVSERRRSREEVVF